MANCKHCGIENTNSAHVRWCKSNPKLEDNKQAIRDAFPSEVVKARVKKAHAAGKYEHIDRSVGRPQTEATKVKLSEICSKLTHRRLVKSCRDYVKRDGSIVKLDSSWEEALAKRLDDMNIDWIRPEPIVWFDALGKQHNYFPDFYLPAHDVYLDPKNSHAYAVQKDKLDILLVQLPNLVIIKTLAECQNFSI